jgi:hypothetical protein
MSPEEMSTLVQQSMEYGHWLRMLQLAEEYNVNISGRVERDSHHYVHERSTSFTLYAEYYGDTPPPEIEKWVDENANVIEKEIGEKVVEINHKIYKALEREWDYRLSDEAVDQDIAANQEDQTYDEEGGEGGELTWNQLSDSAKEHIRERWRNSIYEDPDTFWSECIIEEWTDELAKMGFGDGSKDEWKNGKQVQHADPAISWSGFSSQGDGASFTTKLFDFKKFVEYFQTGQEAIPGPMADSLNEAEDPAAQVDDEINQMVRDTVFTDYSQIMGGEDTHHEGKTTHYVVSLNSRTNDRLGVYGYLHMWVTKHKVTESVVLELRLQARDTADSEPEDKKFGLHRLLTNGQIERKVKFWVPLDAKGNFMVRLSDFVDYATGVINRRVAGGNEAHLPVHPQKFVNSIAYKLSKFGGLWKRENEEARRASYKKTVDALVTGSPEWMAHWRNKARGRTGVEEAEDDMLKQVSNSTLASTFPFQSFMADISNAYWNGMKQYSWHRENESFRITAVVGVSNLELKEPWTFDIRVKDNETTQTWEMHLAFTDLQEKASLGPMVKGLLEQCEEVLRTADFRTTRSTTVRQNEFLRNVAGAVNQVFRTAGYFQEY